jgi:hypothetical protein
VCGRGVWRFLILPPKNPSLRHLNPCRRLQPHDPQQLAALYKAALPYAIEAILDAQCNAAMARVFGDAL